jgi:carbamoyltransferase
MALGLVRIATQGEAEVKICGLKLTHDAAVAGIEDGRLVFCVEIEKLDNRPRYTKMTDTSLIDRVLRKFNFEPDVIVVDGWKGSRVKETGLAVASYHEFDGDANSLLTRSSFSEESGAAEYGSYPHITGHVVGTYATSPFAAKREPAYVITWDGGQNARVHFVQPDAPAQILFHCALHEMYGIIYGIMGYYFGPYAQPSVAAVPLEEIAARALYGGYDKPGKLMSWIGFGNVVPSLLVTAHEIYLACLKDFRGPRLGYNQNGILEHDFMRRFAREAKAMEVNDADALATVHKFLEQLLVTAAVQKIPRGSNLCFTGGSALNIKWNSALRRSGHFADVWVPPFPNDSGSALGVACAEMALLYNRWALDWSVYSGPSIDPPSDLKPGWSARRITPQEVAALLHNEPRRPIVALNGRAEIGPRALGNRSILASAGIASNKTRLNDMKAREPFRPVAPICLERVAPRIFDPGTPDPYMLFDHLIRPEFWEHIPAVQHIDGTARLQTVNEDQNPLIHALLTEYERLSGIGLLCNTSANYNGSGFFPDVESAMLWGQVSRIWSDGWLYERSEA